MSSSQYWIWIIRGFSGLLLMCEESIGAALPGDVNVVRQLDDVVRRATAVRDAVVKQSHGQATVAGPTSNVPQ